MAFLVPGYVVVWFVLVVASILGAGRVGVRGGGGGGETNFKLGRSSFPKGFVFGIGSSAYQFEGAAKEGGKGLSIWDVYAHKHPEKIKDGSNADVTVDEYHLYKEDVSIMKDIGLDAYRLSISWARILPKGNLRGGLNQEGIQYYNDLINELLSKGIQPYVTIFHWDSPQGLEDEYLGFLSSKVVKDFRDYADICFKEFGDRVKHWITFNEPHSFCVGGYAKGTKAPGRCSAWEKGNCSVGDSATEPYRAAHNMLIAHAAAVKLYRKIYQKHQRGIIGIILDSPWMVPSSSSKADEEAAHRAFDYTLGWYMEPLANGQYPQTMVAKVGDRLPKFTERESQMLIRSFDFIGINYYSGFYATAIPPSDKIRPSYDTDMLANITLWSSDGKPIGAVAGSSWLTYYPQGIHDFMVYMKKKYNNPPIYITENGWNTPKNDSLSIEEELKDDMRINYYKDHLEMLHKAIHSDGVDVRGFFGWSLLDNYEWAEGFTVRFGICYVDFKNDLKRYLKQSAHWFQKFLKG